MLYLQQVEHQLPVDYYREKRGKNNYSEILENKFLLSTGRNLMFFSNTICWCCFCLLLQCIKANIHVYCAQSLRKRERKRENKSKCANDDLITIAFCMIYMNDEVKFCLKIFLLSHFNTFPPLFRLHIFGMHLLDSKWIFNCCMVDVCACICGCDSDVGIAKSIVFTFCAFHLFVPVCTVYN